MMLQSFRASKLLDLRTKARIFVPNGRAMMGCLDETRSLDYGQVFVQYSSARQRKFCDNSSGDESIRHTNILKGKVVVEKNPCLHPRAIFASHGSDLDGDIYFVSWDYDLIPPWQFPPMDYIAAQSKILDHDVTIEEVQEYFTDYMRNDSVGFICNAHTVFADKERLMARSKECIELARLASIAVDFLKTGVPAKIPPELRVKEYPDFMEKADHCTYESQRILGKLYRAVKVIAPDTCPIKSFTKEVASRSYDPDMKVDGFEDYINDAFYNKNEYDNKLGNMLDYYGIKTEVEIIIGFITKLGKSFDKRRDLDAINFSVKSLRKQARAWFSESDSDANPNDLLAKASAWYYVIYHPNFWGHYNEGMDRDHFLSFPWCVYGKLVDIKKGKT